jgi:folate-binding protein YgfZ
VYIFYQGYNQDAVRGENSTGKVAPAPQKSLPMTETDVALTTPATPLAVLLETAAKPHANGVYRGALSPQEFDAPGMEIAALAAEAAVHDLGWMRRVAVRGEDRFRWLSGMVTNAVNELGHNTGAWNLVLNAQGRIQGDLHVWRERDDLELVFAADQYEKLIEHLERFIVMDDVELATLSGETALGLRGPLADEVLARLSLPALSEAMTSIRMEWNGLNLRIVRVYGALGLNYELWAPEAGVEKLWTCLCAAGAAPVGTRSVEKWRIAEGIPAYGIDMGERDLAQETSQMRALHFSKGCYLGQEVVERIRSRGNVHRRLRQLELTGPPPVTGAELTMEDGTAAGKITSAAELELAAGRRVFALGMIRAEAELKKAPLLYAGGTARILDGPGLVRGSGRS